MNKRAFTLGVGVVLVVGLARPALAHGGYHHAGAQSIQRHYGVQGEVEVTNPGVPTGANDFFAARVMAKGGAGLNWVEAGWLEYGQDLGSDGYPVRRLYVYETDRGMWHYFHTVSVGSETTVRILPTSSCTPSSTSCYWGAYELVGGTWEWLVGGQMPFGQLAYMEEYGEVANFDSGTHFAIDAASNSVNWDSWLRSSGGAWSLWASTVLTQPSGNGGYPYCAAWQDLYWNFYNLKTTQAACPS